MNDMDTLFTIIFIIAIAEMIISGTWQSFYFTFGIPMYKKSELRSLQPYLSPDELNGFFKKGISNPILFRKIASNQVAFRESLFSFRLMNYSPVMHGLIQYHQGELKVVGLANWGSLVFLAFFIAMGAGFGSPKNFNLLFTILPIGFFALFYFIQVKRFNRLYNILSGQR